MSWNKHWNRIRRAKPRLEPRHRILIVSEGEVTEPIYFRDLGRRVRTQLEITVVGPAGVPVSVVQKAVDMKKKAEIAGKKQQDSFIPFDEVWCVFDVDEHPNLTQAINRAKTNNIGVALSNPCFELWLVLHYQDQRAHIHRDVLQTLCAQLVPGYKKHPPCEELFPRLGEALSRAQNLDRWQRHQSRPNGNPTTDVHRLVKQILALAKGTVIHQLKK
jgi:hypothetical protein